MQLKQLEPGDMLFAATPIVNDDGSLPGYADNAVVAPAGRRGVLINTGHLEEFPDKEVFLVRFEDDAGQLGAAVTCWAKELTATRAT